MALQHAAQPRRPAACLLRRSRFQWQGKRNDFSRKGGKRSGSNKDLSHNPPLNETRRLPNFIFRSGRKTAQNDIPLDN